MPSVSLCAIVHNAEQHAEALVAQLRPVVDEVLFWDQDSGDGSLEILGRCADLVLSVPYKGFGNLDRISFSRVASQDWILSCDVRAEPTVALIEFLVNWRETPTAHVEVFWIKQRTFVDDKDVTKLEMNPYHPFLWRRLNARNAPMIAYDEPFGDEVPRAQTPFQAWLGDDFCLDRHLSYDDLVQRHVRDSAAERHRVLQLPSRARERGYLVNLSREIDRETPPALRELLEAS